MDIKRLISIFMIFNFNCHNSFAQDLTQLDNESIHYEIVYVSPEYSSEHNTYVMSKYIVQLSLNENESNYLSKLSFNDWVNMLDNKDKWISLDLILYCLTKRDASRLYHTKRTDWNHVVKNDDISYWRKYLKKNIGIVRQELKELK